MPKLCGYTIICDCGSENVEELEDENAGSCEDYAVFECKECGNKFKIELPN